MPFFSTVEKILINITPCGLCRSSDVCRAVGGKDLEQIRLFEF
jgi:hypothetical protein